MSKKEIYKFECTSQFEKYYSEDSFYGAYNVITEQELPHSQKYEGFSMDENSSPVYFVNIAGKTQRLYIGCKYEIEATLEFSNRYNCWQYVPINIRTIKPTTLEDNKKFLLSILTENQTNTLLETYPNIVDMVMNKEEVDLSKLKGIKDKTFNKIKDKILDAYGMSDLLVMLQPLGITLKQIEKIKQLDDNTEIVKQKICENPYILTEIKGLGFKKVDGIANKINPNVRESRFRTIAFIKYFFTQLGSSKGDTLCKVSELINEASDTIPECLEILNNIIEENRVKNRLLFVKDDIIGLNKYIDTERRILDLLNFIEDMNKDYTEEVDLEKAFEISKKRLGYDFTYEQKNAVKSTLDNGVVIITAKAGCVDCDTEFFNGKEWKPISKYDTNDKVLQYNEDGTTTLVTPYRYIKQKQDILYHMHNNTYSVDQVLSDNHNVVYLGYGNKLHKEPFSEVMKKNELNKHGFTGRFINTFNYNGSGINLSEFEIRLMCAIICDGTLYNSNNKCRLHLKKQRKKDRIEWIFKELNLTYEKKESSAEGYHDYYFKPPRAEKEFSYYWYDCNQEQLKIVCSEILYWDGSFGKGNRRTFSTCNKNTADFVQFAFSGCGERATIGIRDRRGQKYKDSKYIRKSIEYTVVISNNKTTSICGKNYKNEIEEYKTKDGYEYCFTVPSGMLVLRRNNRIFVTGNCGKTSVINGILDLYKDKCKIVLCSLSAKAVRRMVESTGREAKTIHSLLGFGQSQDDVFLYNENNPLDLDILIIDEATMINAELMLALLKALKPTSKVVLVFDPEQLPPIGYGNVATDLLKSDFTICELTKVHRQALDSGILTDANMIREQKFPIKNPVAKEVHGKLGDLCYMFRNDREQIRDIAVNHFLKTIEKEGNSIENTIIITPRKDNCINSALEINKIIQDKLISKDTIGINRGDVIFRKGCRVIQRVNNKEKNVINGELGYITDVFTEVNEKDGKEKKYFTITFDKIANEETKVVTFEQSDLGDIQLGYCLTAHSVQGSEWGNVIICIDMTHYNLLSSNILYTCMTRAKEKCLLAIEPSAFTLCIRKKANKRKTWLRKYIKN